MIVSPDDSEMFINRTFLLIGLCLLASTVSFSQVQTTVQRGHTRAVFCLSYSPDGKYLASGSADKSIKLWEIETGREVRSYLGHESSVNALVFSPDGGTLITASRDQTVRFWDVTTSTEIKKIRFEDENIKSLALSPDGLLLAIGGTGKQVHVWDINADSAMYHLRADPAQRGAQVSISPSGRQLLIGHDNRKATLHDLLTGDLIHTYEETEGYCGGCPSTVAFLPNGSVVKGARRSGLKVFNDDSEKVLEAEPSDNFDAIAVSPVGDRLIAADEEKVISYELNQGNGHNVDFKQTPLEDRNSLLHRVPERSSDQVNEVVFSPDGIYFATADNSNLISIYDSETGKKQRTFYGYLSVPALDGLEFDPNSYWEWFTHDLVSMKNEVLFSPNGKYALRGKTGKEVRMWELATGKIIQRFSGHSKAVLSFAINNDGSRLITGSADRTAKIWDVGTGEQVLEMAGHRGMIYQVGLSHDESKILTSSDDGTISIWEANSGELIKSINLSDDPLVIETGYAVKFTPNGLYIVVSLTSGSLKLIEIDTGREIREFVGHTRISMDFEFSSNQNTLISVGWDNSIRQWDLRSGLQERKFVGHHQPVHAIAINRTGTMMATGSSDRTLILWNLQTGEQITRLTGHSGIITSVDFSPDGKRLISGTIDGVSKVWDIESSSILVTHYSIGENDWLATNPDGYFTGTDNAQQQVFFVNGIESYGLDRFFDTYYKPDLLKDALGFKKPNERGFLDRLEKFPPPKLELVSPTYGQTTKSELIDVLVKVTNLGGGVDRLRLYHNGKVREEISEIFSDLETGKSMYQKFQIPAIPGVNTIKLVATNMDKIESRAAEVSVIFESPSAETVCYVMAVGINTYQNPGLNLNYAKDDALSFLETIKDNSSGLFDRVEVNRLFDEDATKDNILGVLDALAHRINPGDVFYFYYAGHGSMVDDTFYFVPTENTRLYSSDKLKKTGISAPELQEKLKNISALKQLVLMDACQSGGSAELLATRGAEEEKAMAQLSRSTGIHVLSAAGSEQFATEYSELGHGLFTYVLLEALSGKADGAPKDGIVTIYELKSYIDSLVPEYSRKFKGKLQYPYTFSRGHDFPVARVKY